jgi:hypothetical protein
MICALTAKRFFFRLSATRVMLRNRCDQHARGGLVLDQAVTDDIGVGVALAPEGRDGAADISRTLGEIETRTQSQPRIRACQSAFKFEADSISMKFADRIALFSKRNQRHANQFSDFCSRLRTFQALARPTGWR